MASPSRRTSTNSSRPSISDQAIREARYYLHGQMIVKYREDEIDVEMLRNREDVQAVVRGTLFESIGLEPYHFLIPNGLFRKRADGDLNRYLKNAAQAADLFITNAMRRATNPRVAVAHARRPHDTTLADLNAIQTQFIAPRIADVMYRERPLLETVRRASSDRLTFGTLGSVPIVFDPYVPPGQVFMLNNVAHTANPGEILHSSHAPTSEPAPPEKPRPPRRLVLRKEVKGGE